MNKLLLPGLLVLMLTSCKDNSTKGESTDLPKENLLITEKIAYANGLKEFGEIKEINYTFNVKRDDSLVTSRSWSWKPQVDSVTFIQDSDSLSYAQEKDAQDHPDVDQKFINDNYWLLFPFHLVWDEMEFEHVPTSTGPISGKNLQKMIITYPDDAGYTPGDVYEIYFNDAFAIQEWVYLPGGNAGRASPFTWEEYKEFNGMRLATRHRNKEGSFEIFFSEISVK